MKKSRSVNVKLLTAIITVSVFLVMASTIAVLGGTGSSSDYNLLITDNGGSIIDYVVKELAVFAYDPDTDEISEEPVAKLKDPEDPAKFELNPGYYVASYSTKCIDGFVEIDRFEVKANVDNLIVFQNSMDLKSKEFRDSIYCFSN